MFERLMPIFAVIGIFSSLGYAGLTCWVVYSSLIQNRKKRPMQQLPPQSRQT